MHLSVAHGAYLAEVLGEDEVGGEPMQLLFVDGDNRLSRLLQPAYLGIDVAASRLDVHRSGGHAGQVLNRGGIVTLVRDPHQESFPP
jgi:hypothetical protein